MIAALIMEQHKFKRGDIVAVAVQGDFGKPRPALIIQADEYAGLESITIALMTSEQHPWIFRVPVGPTKTNGLKNISDIMVDKLITVPRSRIGSKIGVIDSKTLLKVEQALMAFLGLVSF